LSGSRPQVPRKILVALCAVLVGAFLLRAAQISDLTFSFDESCSSRISSLAWDETLQAVSRDAHPPLYYVLQKGWRAAFGDSAVALRSLSVLLGLATILAAFSFVRAALADDGMESYASDRNLSALVASMFVAISALQVAMSFEARPYSLGTFLTVTSALLVMRATGSKGCVGDWGLFVTAAALLSFTHYYGLFTVAGEFLFAATVFAARFWREGWNSRTKSLGAGIGLSAWSIQLIWLAWLPVFQFQRERANRQLWMDPLDMRYFSDVAWRTLAGAQTSLPAADSWGFLAVFIWATSIATLLFCKDRHARLLGFCAGTPVVGCIVYGIAVRNILGVRYLVFAHLCLMLGWSLLIARLRWPMVRAVLTGTLLAWLAFGCWETLKVREFQASSPGARGAITWLNQVRQPKESVIVSSPFLHPVVEQYASEKERIFAHYKGDPRDDLLAGPPLRQTECLSEKQIAALNVECLWTIDIEGANGEAWTVPISDLFGVEAEKRFSDHSESHGRVLIVRKHVQRNRVRIGGGPHAPAAALSQPIHFDTGRPQARPAARARNQCGPLASHLSRVSRATRAPKSRRFLKNAVTGSSAVS
jgi:mannosyltransferase